MQARNFCEKLMQFIEKSPTAYHLASNIAEKLQENGFQKLLEHETWDLQWGKSYFVQRDGAGLIAFSLGKSEKAEDGFRMLGAHSDSPSLQVKPAALQQDKNYYKLAVEIYGGPLLSTWFDRDLSLAGRCLVQNQSGKIQSLLIDFARPLLTLPSLAIHLDREANTNKSVHRQKDIQPLLADHLEKSLPFFKDILLQQIEKEYPQEKIDHILSFDLFCYDFQKPSILGLHEEYLASSRLDNQLSSYVGLQALLQSDKEKNTMFLCFNHEENGSTSISGANSAFIDAIMERLLPQQEEKRRALAQSFLISADNAHANHPTAPEKADDKHPIALNTAPVIKHNANQRYSSNAVSTAIYKKIAQEAGLTTQDFVMRNDMPCGSTIAPMLSSRLGVAAIDVGVASLAMHSIREMTGVQDPYMLYQSALVFYNSDIHKEILLSIA